MVCSLLNQGQLTMSSLGRTMLGEATVRSKIRMSCRFLTSNGLKKDREIIYKNIV